MVKERLNSDDTNIVLNTDTFKDRYYFFNKGKDSKKTSSGIGQGWELREILRALQTFPEEVEN